MNVERNDDYREGVFWLLCGAGFVVMGLAQLDRWLAIQPWYLYALGVGLIAVSTIFVPRRFGPGLLRRGMLPIVISLVVSVLVAVLSTEVNFGDVFPLLSGLLWIGTGLWLMLRRDTAAR